MSVEYIYLTDWHGELSKTPTKFRVGTKLGEEQQGYHRVMFTGPEIYGKRFFRSHVDYIIFLTNRILGIKPPHLYLRS
jgi:hypothetical protein